MRIIYWANIVLNILAPDFANQGMIIFETKVLTLLNTWYILHWHNSNSLCYTPNFVRTPNFLSLVEPMVCSDLKQMENKCESKHHLIVLAWGGNIQAIIIFFSLTCQKYNLDLKVTICSNVAKSNPHQCGV